MSAFSHLLRDAPYFSPAAFESPSSRIKRAPANRTYTKPLINPYKSLSADAFDSFVEDVSGQIRGALAYDPVEAERKKHRGYEGDDEFWLDMGGLPGQFSLSSLTHDQQVGTSKLPSEVEPEEPAADEVRENGETANDDGEAALLDGSELEYPYDDADSQYEPDNDPPDAPVSDTAETAANHNHDILLEDHPPEEPIETSLYPTLDDLQTNDLPPLPGFKPASTLLDRIRDDLTVPDYADSSVDYGSADQTVQYGALPELNGEADDILPADLLLGSEDLDPQDELMMRSDAADAYEAIEGIAQAEQAEERLDAELLRAMDVHAKALHDEEADDDDILEERMDAPVAAHRSESPLPDLLPPQNAASRLNARPSSQQASRSASEVIEIDSSSEGEDEMVTEEEAEEEEAIPPPVPTTSTARPAAGRKTLPSALQSRLLSKKVLRRLDANDKQASGYQSSADDDDSGSGADDRIPNDEGSDGELDAEFRAMQQRMQKQQKAFKEEDFEDRYFDGSDDGDDQEHTSDEEARPVNEEAYDSASSHGTAASQRNKRKWDDEMNDELSDDAVREQERQQSGTLEERVPIPKFFKKDKVSGDYDLAPAESETDEEDISEHETEEEELEQAVHANIDDVEIPDVSANSNGQLLPDNPPTLDAGSEPPQLVQVAAEDVEVLLNDAAANDEASPPVMAVEESPAVLLTAADAPQATDMMQDEVFADALNQIMVEHAAQADAVTTLTDDVMQIPLNQTPSASEVAEAVSLYPSLADLDEPVADRSTGPFSATAPDEDLIDPLLMQADNAEKTPRTKPETAITEPEIPAELLDLIMQSPALTQAEATASSQLQDAPRVVEADANEDKRAATNAISPSVDADASQADPVEVVNDAVQMPEANSDVSPAPIQDADPQQEEAITVPQPPASEEITAPTTSATSVPAGSLFMGFLSGASTTIPRRVKRKTPSLAEVSPVEATESAESINADPVETLDASDGATETNSGSGVTDAQHDSQVAASEIPELENAAQPSRDVDSDNQPGGQESEDVVHIEPFEGDAEATQEAETTNAEADRSADVDMDIDVDHTGEDTASDFHPSMLIPQVDLAKPEVEDLIPAPDKPVALATDAPSDSPVRPLNAILPGIWKHGTPIRFGGTSLEAAVREAAYDPDRSGNLRAVLGMDEDSKDDHGDASVEAEDPQETADDQADSTAAQTADEEEDTDQVMPSRSISIRDASEQPAEGEANPADHAHDVEEPLHDPPSPPTTLDGNDHRAEPGDREMSVMSHISYNMRSVSPAPMEQPAMVADPFIADEATDDDDDDIASQLLSPPAAARLPRHSPRQRAAKLEPPRKKRVTRSMKGKDRETDSEASAADLASRASTPVQAKSPSLSEVTATQESEHEQVYTSAAPMSNTPLDEVEVASLLVPRAARPRIHSHQRPAGQPTKPRHRKQGSESQMRDQSSPPRSQNSSPVTTRSQCTYHKFSIPNPANAPANVSRKGRSRQTQSEETTSSNETHPPYIFLFPGCAASDRIDQMHTEGILDLGTASADEKGAALRLSDHTDAEKVRVEGVPDRVIQSLIRVVGIDMFREGDCEILSPLPAGESRPVAEKKRKRESDAQGHSPNKRVSGIR